MSLCQIYWLECRILWPEWKQSHKKQLFLGFLLLCFSKSLFLRPNVFHLQFSWPHLLLFISLQKLIFFLQSSRQQSTWWISHSLQPSFEFDKVHSWLVVHPIQWEIFLSYQLLLHQLHVCIEFYSSRKKWFELMQFLLCSWLLQFLRYVDTFRWHNLCLDSQLSLICHHCE